MKAFETEAADVYAAARTAASRLEVHPNDFEDVVQDTVTVLWAQWWKFHSYWRLAVTRITFNMKMKAQRDWLRIPRIVETLKRKAPGHVIFFGGTDDGNQEDDRANLEKYLASLNPDELVLTNWAMEKINRKEVRKSKGLPKKSDTLTKLRAESKRKLKDHLLRAHADAQAG